MTKPQPWPRNANWARKDSIGWAEQIEAFGNDAKQALAEGNWYKVKIAITEMQHKAAKIRAALYEIETAPEGVEEDEEAEQIEHPQLLQQVK